MSLEILTGIVGDTSRAARPQIGRHCVIEIFGHVDWVTALGLECICSRAALDQSTKCVAIVFASRSSIWQIGGAVEAIRSLAARKPTVGYVLSAIGASYLLAAACRAVVATPIAPIGMFALTADGEYLPESTVAECDGQTLEALANARPDGDAAVWQALMHDTWHGEQLEGRGVDVLQSADTIQKVLLRGIHA